MTVKQFFKSTAFKCIVTLLCVLLVSGIFLTVMNGLLEVTPEEKRDRAISKIYGTTVSVEEVATTGFNDDSATIDEAYKVEDGNYLIKSTGLGAYSGGSVTCWVVVKVSNNTVTGIGKVVIDSNTKQTLMSQFTDGVLNQFSAKYNPDQPFESSIITGATATLTKNAICNSVNAAASFVQSQFGPVWVSPYADFALTKYINIKKNMTGHEVKDGGVVVYHVVTNGYGDAGSFKIDIEVTDGLISKYEITQGGSTEGYDAFIPASIKNGELFIGKGLDYFTTLYGEDMNYKAIASAEGNTIVTGATTESIASNSSYLCMYAGAFATANYNRVLQLGQGGN